jgi:hypothetical protein
MLSCFLNGPNKAICKRRNPKTTQNWNTLKQAFLGYQSTQVNERSREASKKEVGGDFGDCSGNIIRKTLTLKTKKASTNQPQFLKWVSFFKFLS